MNYTHVLIFSADMNYVLMLRRAFEPYKDMLCGIGGKIEDGEIVVESACREVLEEAMLEFSPKDMHYQVTLSYQTGVTLHCFYCVSDIIPIMHYYHSFEEGELYWVKTISILNLSSPRMAGEGNIAYLVRYALTTYKGG